MRGWSGTIYAAATLTGNGNSGYIDLNDKVLAKWQDESTPFGNDIAIVKAWLRLVPSGLATDETLDLDLNVAVDSAGSGDIKVHDFTQVTSTNAEEDVILPGEDSTDILVAATDLIGACMPRFWKLSWTLGGTTKSMTFTLYGTLVFV